MHRFFFSALLPLACLALASSGCGHRRYYGAGNTVGPPPARLAPDSPSRALLAEYFAPPLPPTPPNVTPPDPVRVAFDKAGTERTLHDLDFRACAARGAPHGYGHARVTFDPRGAVTHVLIDAPSGLSQDAVDCVGEHFTIVGTAPFDGGPVSIGTTFYVG
jgi:hypothetical protein